MLCVKNSTPIASMGVTPDADSRGRQERAEAVEISPKRRSGGKFLQEPRYGNARYFALWVVRGGPWQVYARPCLSGSFCSNRQKDIGFPFFFVAPYPSPAGLGMAQTTSDVYPPPERSMTVQKTQTNAGVSVYTRPNLKPRKRRGFIWRVRCSDHLPLPPLQAFASLRRCFLKHPPKWISHATCSRFSVRAV